MQLIDRKTWLRAGAVVAPLFTGATRWYAVGGFALLMALLLVINGMNVANNHVLGAFMTSIERRDAGGFTAWALLYVVVFLASTLLAVASRYAEERLGLSWRDWLTRKLLDRYLADGMSERLARRVDLDNPDQRIAEDAKNFTNGALSLFLLLLNAALTLLAFVVVLWRIDPWLVAAAAGYAAIGSAVTMFVGRRLVDLDVRQSKQEADFRHELIRLRDQSGDRAGVMERFREVWANFRRIIDVNRNVGFCTTGYNYLAQIIPVLIVAPLYMRGEAEFGVIPRAAMAFSFVLNASSLLVTEIQRLSAFAAVVHRLGTFWEATEPTPPAAQEAVSRAG